MLNVFLLYNPNHPWTSLVMSEDKNCPVDLLLIKINKAMHLIHLLIDSQSSTLKERLT